MKIYDILHKVGNWIFLRRLFLKKRRLDNRGLLPHITSNDYGGLRYI